MKLTTENINGIMLILSLLERKYPEKTWGGYEMHYVTETNEYKVLLLNGITIRIHRTIAQYAEKDIRSITDESIERILNTYTII